MSRPDFCVDWDGTCVEEYDLAGNLLWPGPSGEWLPGAVEALRELSSRGTTVIYSLRCHAYQPDHVTRRCGLEVAQAVLEIRTRLDDVGLHAVRVYPNGHGKPPAKVYIDDRGLHFTNWADALKEVRERGY